MGCWTTRPAAKKAAVVQVRVDLRSYYGVLSPKPKHPRPGFEASETTGLVLCFVLQRGLGPKTQPLNLKIYTGTPNPESTKVQGLMDIPTAHWASLLHEELEEDFAMQSDTEA